ncbi:hypothetical protein BLNAU_22195 [Blattamonas nauphoetae]|uniref:Uncharacterized protein n=1 Tax=Blattamonas nauphoetae TaxID=2049346 RepID=A0ABQ9WTS5_9EUKA|nr:hypothetical protein BLNAU_22195 [Blattamonas nauphoetae]
MEKNPVPVPRCTTAVLEATGSYCRFDFQAAGGGDQRSKNAKPLLLRTKQSFGDLSFLPQLISDQGRMQ